MLIILRYAELKQVVDELIMKIIASCNRKVMHCYTVLTEL